MIRHRCRQTRLAAAAVLAAATLFAAAALPGSARAQSVQVFVNTAFVNSGLPATPSAASCTSGGNPVQFYCPLSVSPLSGGQSNWPGAYGNISNDPEIQFESDGTNRCNLSASATNTLIGGTLGFNVCNNQVFLCTQVGLTIPPPASGSPAPTVAIDKVEFEVFRYIDGSNPLDATSTPPLRTFAIDSAGVATYNDGTTCNGSTCKLPDATHAYCVLWDGSQAIQGEFGKIDGQYGFRVTVQTNQVGSSGNITLSQTRAYPSGATLDSAGNSVSQKPITVDVTDVHVIRSTPTVVGAITGVSAEPYNFTYRLSKDANMFLSVLSSTSPYADIRDVVPGLPRTGEGNLSSQSTPPLLNGDSWDGRDNAGNFLLPGNYLAVFQANSSDQYTKLDATHYGDLATPTTRQIAIDPLQITDIRVQPLLGGSTSLAVLSYQLTEPATVYLDVYPPGTQFCPGASDQGLNDVNNTAHDSVLPAKNFGASSAGCSSGGGPAVSVAPLREVVQQQQQRTSVISFWDGRDKNGTLMDDGDYVFVMYASLPSRAGNAYNSNSSDKRVWSSVAKTGFISVLRGLVGITQVTPTSSVIGSSPSIAGLDPFTFRYQLSRDANVSMKIFDSSGNKLIKTVVNDENRPGLFNNAEKWDGTDDAGLTVSSGTYLVQLTAQDPSFPAKISTTTALFPVNLFRITDLTVSPLLSGTSDQVTLSYQLSQPMFVAWNIYPAGSVVVDSTGTWPPCPTQSPPASCTSSSVVSPGGAAVSPVVSFHGLRPGRLKISEFWDGRDTNGLFVPDGSYVYTLVAQSTTTPPTFAADRVYGTLTVARGSIIFTSFNVNPDVPQLFNSSNTITLDPYTISYGLSRQSSVTVQILNTAIPPEVVRTLVSGEVRPGGVLQTDVWDGRDDKGNFPPSGFYLVRAVAEDVSSVLTSGSTAQLTVSYDPLRIYDLAITPLQQGTGGAVLSYQVSEPMKVAIKIYKPNTGFDGSGNPTPPDSVSLVRRIVGIRPARTQIQDVWDGRDYKLAQVPDGTYWFKIVGSTVPSAIDDITGDIKNPLALAEDRLIDVIPVALNGSADPVGDFKTNSFVYPNPITGPTGTFEIYTPFHATVSLKLYDMAGDLVLDKNFGDQAASYQSGPVTYVWPKTNGSGRQVARGLYYAVIRVEETEGGANVLQTVKKVLIK
jgi:flagellar hook assembly protein FlgD